MSIRRCIVGGDEPRTFASPRGPVAQRPCISISRFCAVGGKREAWEGSLRRMGRVKVPLDFSSGAVWGFWFGIIVALAGVGISVASYIADQQTDAKIATVRAEAAMKVADADAEARRRIAEVERKTQTRRLDDKQRAAFIALFRSDTGRLRVSYLTGQGTGEVGQLISDILDAAKAAGAEIGGNGQAFAVLRPGISFEINPTNSTLAKRLGRLGEALGVQVGVFTNSGPENEVRVLIGSRADGFP